MRRTKIGAVGGAFALALGIASTAEANVGAVCATPELVRVTLSGYPTGVPVTVNVQYNGINQDYSFTGPSRTVDLMYTGPGQIITRYWKRTFTTTIGQCAPTPAPEPPGEEVPPPITVVTPPPPVTIIPPPSKTPTPRPDLPRRPDTPPTRALVDKQMPARTFPFTPYIVSVKVQNRSVFPVQVTLLDVLPSGVIEGKKKDGSWGATRLGRKLTLKPGGTFTQRWTVQNTNRALYRTICNTVTAVVRGDGGKRTLTSKACSYDPPKGS